MSTSRSLPPLRHRMQRRLRSAIERMGLAHARIVRSRDFPDLLWRISQHYAGVARRRGAAFVIDLDPALAPDLIGPHGALGKVLCLLLDRAFATPGHGTVALQVDVVGGHPGFQLIHVTVADEGLHIDSECLHLDHATAAMAALHGVLHRECGADTGTRIIAELAFALPPHHPRIDVDTLRATLGGTRALREVIVALDEALTHDLAGLDVLLGQPGVGALQAWLHRASGALGMAEATDLARTGLTLERLLADGRDTALDTAIRRFGDDAARVIQLLREHVRDDGL